ncbi:hypothetical protein LSH36_65g07062 [Paralvinella palmiformis]|uniref:NTF2-related export protein n=1 Tax=Paralvinella palmiformis TaxID=53620 RepID=A0AAD9K3Q0_9ANNE|nr:hypothetical protein LSH36_65g07062 [Paralvinella palmiformis]
MAQTEKAPWEQLGEEFIKQYYMLFDTLQKTALLGLYHATAMITFEENKAQGHPAIKDILENKITFQKIKHVVTKVDCQPTAENGVLVLVTGRLQTDDDPPHAFSQLFFLKPADNSYFIFHDIFRLSIHNA